MNTYTENELLALSCSTVYDLISCGGISEDDFVMWTVLREKAAVESEKEAEEFIKTFS